MHIFIGKVGEVIYDGKAYSLTAPGSAGEMTILHGHMPLVTTLKPGVVRLHVAQGDEAKEFAIDGGVLEVTGDGAQVLL